MPKNIEAIKITFEVEVGGEGFMHLVLIDQAQKFISVEVSVERTYEFNSLYINAIEVVGYTSSTGVDLDSTGLNVKVPVLNLISNLKLFDKYLDELQDVLGRHEPSYCI